MLLESGVAWIRSNHTWYESGEERWGWSNNNGRYSDICI